MPAAAPLHLQRCFHHAGREAVARCPQCGRFYCRECVSEHEGRLLCASCLAKTMAPAPGSRSRWRNALRLLAGLAGLLVAWLFFYLLAAVLISIPTDFHQMDIWNKPWLQE